MSPLPQRLAPEADAATICDVGERWGIHPTLAWKLHYLSIYLPFDVSIMSGFRTPEHQRELIADPDTTAAPVDLSTHTSCPATGADLTISVEATDQVKRTIGAACEKVGLRWGGGARRENGIPIGVEWRHVDLGPRASRT